VFDLQADTHSGQMVGYTEVIQDGHRAHQYQKVGFYTSIDSLLGLRQASRKRPSVPTGEIRG
jgi:hypothetical protein